jgi:hypothetical protein
MALGVVQFLGVTEVHRNSIDDPALETTWSSTLEINLSALD